MQKKQVFTIKLWKSQMRKICNTGVTILRLQRVGCWHVLCDSGGSRAVTCACMSEWVLIAGKSPVLAWNGWYGSCSCNACILSRKIYIVRHEITT